MNINEILAIAFCFVPSIGLLLVLRYHWFIKHHVHYLEDQRNNSFKSILSVYAPYEKYLEILKRRSVCGNTVRRRGDFLDFFLEFTDISPDLTECNLKSISCGESD